MHGDENLNHAKVWLTQARSMWLLWSQRDLSIAGVRKGLKAGEGAFSYEPDQMAMRLVAKVVFGLGAA